MYICHIRIEYCIQAWSPYFSKDTDMLEKIQYCATKMIHQLANLPHKECIQNLSMYSLYCKCERGDLNETFKILKQHLLMILVNYLLYYRSISLEDTASDFLSLDSDS